MTVTINGTTGVAGVDGTASTPAIQGNDTNTGIFFPAADTIAFAEGGAEVARFDSSGNLGIGTSSPSNKLQVSGSAGSTVARFTDGANGTFLFQFASSESRIQDGGANNLWVYDNSGQNSKFYTNNTERMRITSAGDLLVGTTSPPSSSVKGFGVRPNSGVGYYIASSVSLTGSVAHAEFYNPNGTVGSISTSGSGTTYATSSDYRLKENIAPMTGALGVVQQLKPVTYNWKVDGSSGQGFIAHELQAVVPDCVTGDKDAVETYIDEEGVEQTRPKYQGIDTSFLVATLTAAIQEQQAIITDLKARIETLEGK